MIDPTTTTAREIAAAVRSGRLRSEAVAEVYKDRIAAREPQVRAFIHQPMQVKTSTDGPLAGVPLGIKDVIDTGDMPTSYGSAAYQGVRPARDAACVHLVRRAGASLMGKTVTTEFATAAPGATTNPFSPTRTPGGSSSGSAAGLGAGLFALAFGTQTSGSTIRPASYCGVVGYKASRGLIDRQGVKPLSESLDVVGLMARDVLDVALLAAVTMRRPELMVEPEAPASIGLFLPAHEGTPAEDSIACIEHAALALPGIRAVVEPEWWQGLAAAQADVFAWESSAALAPERDLHWDVLQPATHDFLRRHDGVTFARWQAGIAQRDHALADLESLFRVHDVIITQAAPGEAPQGLQSTGPAAFNIRYTLLGLPNITVPAGLGPAAMPIGLQVVARPGQDRALLSAAAFIEERLRRADIPARPE